MSAFAMALAAEIERVRIALREGDAQAEVDAATGSPATQLWDIEQRIEWFEHELDRIERMLEWLDIQNGDYSAAVHRRERVLRDVEILTGRKIVLLGMLRRKAAPSPPNRGN